MSSFKRLSQAQELRRALESTDASTPIIRVLIKCYEADDGTLGGAFEMMKRDELKALQGMLSKMLDDTKQSGSSKVFEICIEFLYHIRRQLNKKQRCIDSE